MPIWHIDFLCTPTVTVDIGLIRDEANKEAQNSGPGVEVQPLSENLAYTVEQAHEADHAASEPIDTTTVECTPGTSGALCSSRSKLSAALVSIARLHKLESQMSTLLHHI